MKFKKQLKNYLGWQTNRKLVVIESDDWGTIAVKSQASLNNLKHKGVKIPDTPFALVDSLESNTDLDRLFDLLSEFKDIKGNSPCITTCSIMANPDYAKIKESGYSQYYYETFDETYNRYPNHDKVFELLKTGIENGFIYPQFHGREHLNPNEWLKVLKSGNQNELKLFEEECLIGLLEDKASKRFNGYFAAFDYESEEELKGFENVIAEGQAIFKDKFGFYSKSFVAPTGIRSDKIDEYLMKNNIQYHQLGQQFLPPIEKKYAHRQRFFGSTNELGQTYWRRNGFFEPSRDRNKDWISSTLLDAEAAFSMKKPFVISSHRVNFVGEIDESNRDNGIKNLKLLLKALLDKYPDIEFINSAELGDEIEANEKYALGLRWRNHYMDKKYKH